MLGMNLLAFFFVVVQIHSVTPVNHTLNYFMTASRNGTRPEYMEVVYVDDVQILQFDSNHGKMKVKHDWVNKITEDDPYFWKRETEMSYGTEQDMKNKIEIAKKHFHQTGELPKMFLLQKTPSSPVTCHATGFYPRTSSLFWRKNGEEIDKVVEKGETLPNHDETFQTSVHLKVEVTPAAEQEYECVFRLAGVSEDIVIKLDARSILSNAHIREQDWKTPVAIAVPLVVLGLVALAVVVVVVFLAKRLKSKQAEYSQACEEEKPKEEEEEEENGQLTVSTYCGSVSA
ncbi:BOLA class I histocompatibility antigen, alpha chain BL3-6-like isoform 2-T2 [Syngnathus typhle]